MAQPTAVDRLYEEIHALSEDDRALLLDRLWADEWRDVPGFEHPIEDEECWREEIARRAADPEDDDVPWEVVKAELLAELHARQEK